MYTNGFWLIVTSIIWQLPVTLFAATTDYLALISPSMQPDRTWEAILPGAFPGITILPSTKGLSKDEIYKYENRMEPDLANVLSVISQSKAERLVIFIMLDSQINDSHHMLRLSQVDALGKKRTIVIPTDEVFRDIAEARRGKPVDVYITSAGGGEVFGSLPKGSSVVTLSGPRESTPGNETENMFELFSVAKKMFRSDVGIERLLLTHLALVNTSTQSTLHMGSGLAITPLEILSGMAGRKALPSDAVNVHKGLDAFYGASHVNYLLAQLESNAAQQLLQTEISNQYLAVALASKLNVEAIGNNYDLVKTLLSAVATDYDGKRITGEELAKHHRSLVLADIAYSLAGNLHEWPDDFYRYLIDYITSSSTGRWGRMTAYFMIKSRAALPDWVVKTLANPGEKFGDAHQFTVRVIRSVPRRVMYNFQQKYNACGFAADH